MIDTMGKVTSVDGDYAIVQIEETGCGRCREDGGCGGHSLGKMFCNAPKDFRVLNPGGASIGDRVTVSIADGVVRHTAILAYGLPLLALFAGALAGQSVAGEAGAIGGSIVGLMVAWVALRHFLHCRNASQNFQPRIKY